MSDTEREDQHQHAEAEDSPAELRSRPGTRGLSSRVFFVLLAVALTPLLALPFALWPLVEDARALPEKLSQELKTLELQQNELMQSLDQALEQNQSHSDELAQARRELRAQTELAELQARLIPLCKTDLGDDELSKNKALRAALKSQQDLFSEVLLLRGEPAKVILSRSGKNDVPLKAHWPELTREFKAGHSPPIPKQAGWTWRSLGESNLILAARLNAPIPDPQPTRQFARPDFKPAVAVVEKLAPTMALTVRALLIALPLFSLGLAGLALWWWRRRFIRPLNNLSQVSRLLLEQPGAVGKDMLAGQGDLAGLAASLDRLTERMRRLLDFDEQNDALAAECLDLKILLERAADGHLSQRVLVESGPLQEVQVAFNRMLDRWSEQAAALSRQAEMLDKHASQMQRLLPNLLSSSSAGARLTTTSEGLVELLGSQADALCKDAKALLDALDRGLAKEDLLDEPGFERAMTDSRLLSDRIADSLETLEQGGALRQNAEVLATNLAISAEADSPAQADKMVEDARTLARELLEFNEQLGESLRHIKESGSKLTETFQQATSRDKRLREALSAGAGLGRGAAALRQRIEAVQPGFASLGADLRRVNHRLEELESRQTKTATSLQTVAGTAENLAEVAAGLSRELQKWDTGQAVPEAITQDLASEHRALSQAIDRLQELARDEGIEGLSAETNSILEEIKLAADEARRRILGCETRNKEA